MKKIIQEYPNVLKKLENNYLGENAVLDKDGNKYSEGITHLDERTSIQVIMNELVSNAQYEVKYKDLTVLPEYLKVTPKLDVMFDNNYIEYKKVKIMYDRGGLDEYVLKKLVNPSAAQSYVNPFTKQSVASSSLTGDIEKVSMLCGEECNRYVLLELWGGEPYTAEPYINMIDSMVNTYYNVERFHTTYNGIHPKMTQCDILCYKILDEKKEEKTMYVNTHKWGVSLDENKYQESLKGLELKELNKMLRNRKACMNKKKKVFVEMREIFQKQIDIIEKFINKI